MSPRTATTLQAHTENLAALLDHLDLQDITFFLQDWAPVVELPGVGHFCQEDAPDVLAAGIDQFIQANP